MALVLDGCKLAWHSERLKDWLDGKKIAPITIDMAFTTHCSYRCVYCYGKMQRINQDPHLERDVIIGFLDDAAEIGVKAISLVSDGESTCSPYLYDAILHAKSKGIDMALGTNGYLLKDDRLEEILPALTYLRFNISAGERARYAEIHGCKEECYDKVINTIKKACEIKKSKHLDVTIGLQMVLMPEFKDQIIPLCDLGKELGADYLVVKHCSDNSDGFLGIDYAKYEDMHDLLKKAESYTDENYLVKVKWSKILKGREMDFGGCYGPQFMLQLSGSGIVAPCGAFFQDRYKKYHIGNINETRFKDIFNSERYDEVMELIGSETKEYQADCASLCLQYNASRFLWKLKHGGELEDITGIEPPQHINFV